MHASTSEPDAGHSPRPDRPIPIMVTVVIIAGLLLISTMTSIDGKGQTSIAPPVDEPKHVDATPPPRQQPSARHRSPRSSDNPVRSVFLLGDQLAASSEDALLAAMIDSGLPVVERQRVDALITEQELARDGSVAASTSIEIGRMLGGHVALIARQDEALIALRAVLIESGELVAARSCSTDRIHQVADEVLREARSRLPAVGRLERSQQAGKAVYRINLGRLHGVQPTDRFAVYQAGRDAGAPLTIAVVQDVEEDAATVVIKGVDPDCPTTVRRLAE